MPVAYDTPIRTNAQNLERVLNSGFPLLLSFEMPGCSPCVELDDPLKQLARAYTGKVLIIRIEDSNEQAIWERFKLSRTPTLIFWKTGREVGRVIGAVEIETLRKIMEFLSGKSTLPAMSEGRSVIIPGVIPSQTVKPETTSPSDSPATPLIVSDSSFERDVLRSHLPVLVDFWAPWCGPCRMVSPIVEELGREYRGRLRVAKVNTDENPRYAGSLGIQGIPTLILFKKGKEANRIVGAVPKGTLTQFIERNLG